MRSIPSRLVVAAATFLSLSLIAAACGSDTATESAQEPSIRVDVYGASFTLDALPERIISLSPAVTEGLFAIGAGTRVIAVDERSDFPAEAPTTDLSGFTPNVEAILALDPDLVIISFNPGDLAASLEAAGVPVLILDDARDIDDVFVQLGILGAVTGESAAAEALVRELEGRIASVVDATPVPERAQTYFHVIDETLFSATSSTFIGSVYGLFGLVNLADPADTDGGAFGYPQLSAEYLVDADPDLVFLANGTPSGFATIPGMETLRAYGADAVIALPPDVASRWGPRIIEFVEAVAEVMTGLATGAPALVP